MMIDRISRLARDSRTQYIIINVLVNLAFVVRSYVTMRALDYAELGYAALLQSIIMIVGLLQFGVINGGSRLACSADSNTLEQINASVYALLAMLCIPVIATTIGYVAWIDQGNAAIVGPLGALGGLATLLRTWLTNMMIARQELARLNGINGWSALLSLALLAFIPIDPFLACMAAVVGHPLLFALLAVIRVPAMLPMRLAVHRAVVVQLLAAGFVPYACAFLVQVQFQVERWYVVGTLGVVALGHLYLAILFITLFQAVTNSIDAVYIPPLAKAHDEDDTAGLQSKLRELFIAQAMISGLALFGLFIVAKPALVLLLPDYIQDIPYMRIAGCGVILFTLVSPLSTIAYLLVQYRYFFLAYLAGLLSMLAVIIWSLLVSVDLDLFAISWLRLVNYAVTSLILIIGFWRMSAGRPGFRFSLLRQRTP